MDNILDKITSGRQYRKLEEFSSGSEEKRVTGYATKFNTEYILWSYDGYELRERIDPHAFDECDMSDVIMQYDHEGRVFARTGNGTLKLDIDSTGLHVDADLSGTELGCQLYDEIRGGYITKMSFGFTVGEDKREITEDHENNKVTVLRTITKITKLYDVSAVSIPANDATEISAQRSFDGVIEELRRESEKRRETERQRQRIRILLEEF